jgi:hypothetical protein
MIDQWNDNPPLLPMFPMHVLNIFLRLHGTKDGGDELKQRHIG